MSNSRKAWLYIDCDNEKLTVQLSMSFRPWESSSRMYDSDQLCKDETDVNTISLHYCPKTIQAYFN